MRSTSKFISSFILLNLTLLLLSVTLHAEQSDLRFKHYSAADGLSQSTILCTEQDSHGFLWFGTYDGLNRFDGYEFKSYKPDPSDSLSLSHNFIGAIQEDHRGNLWVGTDNGLNLYNSNTETFTRFKHDPEDNSSLSNDMVRALLEDSQNRIWIGTRGGGLNRYDQQLGKFKHYLYDPDDPRSISHNTISNIIEDPRGWLWIATDGGLNRFDFATEKFTRFTHDPSNPESISLNNVFQLFLEENGDLWVGTWSGGLNRFNQETGVFKRYDLSRLSGEVNASIIRAIGKDSRGDLWIGTWGSGLFRYEPERDNFVLYRQNPADPESISSDQITCIYKDRSNVFWVGTDFGGLNKLILDSDKFERHHSRPASLGAVKNDNVRALLVSDVNDLWIGTSDGLHRFNEGTGDYTPYYLDVSDSLSLSNNSIRALLQDGDGNIWAGTESGLNRYNPMSDNFKRYFFSPRITGEEPVDMAWSICEDHAGILWIGSFGGGLIRLDPLSDEFTIYLNDRNDQRSIQDNSIWSIVEDQKHNLWIATDFSGLSRLNAERTAFESFKYKTDQKGSLLGTKVLSIFQDVKLNIWIGTTGGFYHFDPISESFARYSEENGLSSSTVQGIVQDKNENLWLTTNKGVSKFNISEKSFKTFSVEDGLQGNEFHVNSTAVGPGGHIYLGGVNGYNKFHPDSIEDSQYSPNILLTDFQIFNASVPVGAHLNDRVILGQSLANTKHIDLTFKENVFSFSFAALDYLSPEKISYAYMMEGFESDWNYVGDRRFATYTNLDPGEYSFKVKATNSDGIWGDQPLELSLTITPPYWQTWWFKSGLSLLILGLLASLYLYRVRLLHIRTRLLQGEVQKQTAVLQGVNNELESANGMKELLLDIITHDLKNPIGVIDSMSDYMLSENPDDEGLGLIRSSSQNLLVVMENATTLARVSMGEKIAMNEINLYPLIKNMLNGFKPLLGASEMLLENNIPINCIVTANPIIEEVFKNFISNAIKYASGGKRLTIDQIEEEDRLIVRVRDFGVTIPKEQRDRVFQRSVQLAKGKKRGRGLGLAIVKRIAEAHDAEVGILPNEPTGNIFYIKIPYEG